MILRHGSTNKAFRQIKNGCLRRWGIKCNTLTVNGEKLKTVDLIRNAFLHIQVQLNDVLAFFRVFLVGLRFSR